jgi:hypothetical protein
VGRSGRPASTGGGIRCSKDFVESSLDAADAFDEGLWRAHALRWTDAGWGPSGARLVAFVAVTVAVAHRTVGRCRSTDPGPPDPEMTIVCVPPLDATDVD